LGETYEKKGLLDMKVLVIGGGGMIGVKLAARLAKDGQINGQEISRLILADVVEPAGPADAPFEIERRIVDISAPGEAAKLVADQPGLIFHLAAIVSGEAEVEFDKGYRINLDGTRYLLEAIRSLEDYTPRLVFTSSIAVFGAPFPSAIPDDFIHTPLTSYGTQKAIDELLVSDYTRKDFVDGVSIRLPTICVRPGLPNKAASGFFSGIIREPLAGEEALLPVSEDVVHSFASPRSAIGFLIHAAGLDGEVIGPRRGLTMPGVGATVGEQIAALRKVAGDNVAARIRHVPDQAIMSIVAGWPTRLTAERALGLGFKADASFEDIIRVHINEELGGDWAR
jgi:nucleoside-diphosphate-sugar epimerase